MCSDLYQLGELLQLQLQGGVHTRYRRCKVHRYEMNVALSDPAHVPLDNQNVIGKGGLIQGYPCLSQDCTCYCAPCVCAAINTCLAPLSCSQFCHRDDGRDICSCRSGYTLEADGSTCAGKGRHTPNLAPFESERTLNLPQYLSCRCG